MQYLIQVGEVIERILHQNLLRRERLIGSLERVIKQSISGRSFKHLTRMIPRFHIIHTTAMYSVYMDGSIICKTRMYIEIQLSWMRHTLVPRVDATDQDGSEQDACKNSTSHHRNLFKSYTIHLNHIPNSFSGR